MGRVSILSTAILDEEVLQKVDSSLFSVSQHSFIENGGNDSDEVRKIIAGFAEEKGTVVFTSKNSVKAVASMTGDVKPDWEVYSLGTNTTVLAKRLFAHSRIVGTADSAEGLAAVIIGNGTDRVMFFCGDIRLDTLPGRLVNAGVRVDEVIVYRTIVTPKLMNEQFDGILFFSPSGVRSYFSINTVGPETILFAIGHTTGDELRKCTSNRIVVSKVPGKEQVLMDSVAYFSRRVS